MIKKKGLHTNQQIHKNNIITQGQIRLRERDHYPSSLIFKNFCKAETISCQLSLLEREKAVTLRETLVGIREKKAEQLEQNDTLNKKLKKAQKELDSAKAVQKTAPKENLLEANERLLIATINAQKMKENAELASLQMAQMAQHDSLTGLPNRSLLKERLSQAIGIAQRHGNQIALMFLDLDLFKHINDSLGHSIGDKLLKSVGSRLLSCVRSTDTVCRLGGDEFVIMLAEINDPQVAAHIAEKIYSAFSDPCIIRGHELHVSLSVGISIYPDDSLTVNSLIQNADTAMYHAKKTGRNHFEFFQPDMNAKAVRRISLEKGIRRALIQKEFILRYQPKINLLTSKMTGSEALIRWIDPELGIIYPDDFLRIAEESHLILEIDGWVINEACKQMKKWLDSGLSALSVAINVSALSFRDKDFLKNISQILEKTGLAPHYLELELTENILMENAESSVDVLNALKEMGIKLAIDNFGIGFSSLSYLRRFQIDTLKIDKSFVNRITFDKDHEAIVNAVIGMGKNLNQRVIAEGVETPGQLACLLTLKCDEGQGFHFNHPMTKEDFTLLLQPPKDVVI